MLEDKIISTYSLNPETNLCLTSFPVFVFQKLGLFPKNQIGILIDIATKKEDSTPTILILHLQIINFPAKVHNV